MMFDQNFGSLMAQEIEQAPAVFVNCMRGIQISASLINKMRNASALYTIARGSSDAVATVLAYEFMGELRRPTTSMPPSIFSLNDGLDMRGQAALVISQSGASKDLVQSATLARAHGAIVCAITNVVGSGVENAADVTIPVGAGPERAVPATKTVIGSIAAGMALLSHLSPAYAQKADFAAQTFNSIHETPHLDHLVSALLRAQNVYVIGRGAGLGAAQEIALKLKEC